MLCCEAQARPEWLPNYYVHDSVWLEEHSFFPCVSRKRSDGNLSYIEVSWLSFLSRFGGAGLWIAVTCIGISRMT